jgi:DNA polymerase III epsilon subunit-like protein
MGDLESAFHPRRTVEGVETVADDAVRFAVVDVETSGLSLRRHRVLQVGVVLVDRHGRVLDRWASLVRPRRRVFYRVGPTRLHGIRRRAVRDAPTLVDVIGQLADRLHGAVFVAHNAAFDLAFLHKAAAEAGTPLPIASTLCTLQLSRQLDPDRQLSHRLSALCDRYDVVLVRPHDAMADADATAAVLPHLLVAHGIDSSLQVGALVQAQRSA